MTTSTILSDNGATSGSAGLKTTGGDDGTLVIQTTTSGGTATTAITVSNTQVVSLANALPVASGGTGSTTLTANNVLLGNGTSALQAVAPGTSGNVLTSNGTTWTSSAPSGGVTSLNGATGAITTTTAYALGSFVVGRPQNTTAYAVGATIAGSSLYATFPASTYTGTAWKDLSNNTIPANCRELVNTGSWRCVTPAGNDGTPWGYCGLWVRYA